MKIEKIILIVITSILILTAFEVKAETEIDYSTSLVRYTIDGTTSSLNVDNYINFDPGETVTYLAPRIWFPTPLEQNKTYKIEFTLGWRPSDYIGYLEDRTTAEQFNLLFGKPTFWGSIEGSAVTGVIENPFNVATCSYIQQEDQIYRFDVICYIQPNVNLQYVNLRWTLTNNNSDTLLAAKIRHLRYQSLIITYQPTTTDSLLNQQIIIQQDTNNTLNSIKDTITGDYEYNDEPTEQIQGKEEMDEMKELEENILDNLDLSATEELDITINPEASKFIWDIVEQLRGINDKIIMLITSILGLGIIKMILNR